MNQTKVPPEPAATETPAKQLNSESNLYLSAGLGVGALGIGGAMISGAICPLCYVVPPLLVAAGAVQKYRARKLARLAPEGTGDTKDSSPIE